MRLTNLVASGDLHQPLDLEQLRELGDRYRYDVSNYHGGYILLARCKATVYRSGKYIFTGLKDLAHLDETWAEFLERLVPYIDVDLAVPPTVRNMVLLEDLGRPIDLERLCIAARDRAEYEPEQFPGLVYTLPKGKALVFATGKIVITGVTSWEEAETAVAGLRTDLHPF
ncbi:Transcription factor TFIID [anaerobic digester metagenome]